MDIGNTYKKLVKIACVLPEISSRTDRQTYSPQYFATTPASEVTICLLFLQFSQSQADPVSVTQHLEIPVKVRSSLP